MTTTAKILDFSSLSAHIGSGKSSIPTVLEHLRTLDELAHKPLEIPALQQEQVKIARIYSDEESKAEVDVVEYVTANFEVGKANFFRQITSAVENAESESRALGDQLANMEATLKTVKQYLGDPSDVKPMKFNLYKIAGLIFLQIAVLYCTVATNMSEFSLESAMSQAALDSGEQ